MRLRDVLSVHFLGKEYNPHVPKIKEYPQKKGNGEASRELHEDGKVADCLEPKILKGRPQPNLKSVLVDAHFSAFQFHFFDLDIQM